MDYVQMEQTTCFPQRLCLTMPFCSAVHYWSLVREIQQEFAEDLSREPAQNVASKRLASFLSAFSKSANASGSAANVDKSGEHKRCLCDTATEDDQVHLETHLCATRNQVRCGDYQDASLAANTDNANELVCVFEEVRASLQSMRENFMAGNRAEIQQEALRIEREAARVGAKGVSLKARALRSQTTSGIRTVHIDALEQQLDASEAIYHSCRLRV
jgi:hypothetical protein